MLLLDPSWMGVSLYLGSKRYNFKACKSIPLFSSVLSHNLQMHWYYNQKSSIFEAAITDPSVQPAPVSRVKPAQTQFKVQDPVYNQKSTNNKFSVEVKFQKYILDSTSSKETNILQFWEVRYNWMAFSATTHSLKRLIRPNSQCFSQLP